MYRKLLGILPFLFLSGYGLRAQCPTSNAGPNDTVCVNSPTTLAAVLPEGFTGTWARIGNQPAASITKPTSPTSTVTNLTGSGNLRLTWTISGSGACSSVDTVTILVAAIPTASGNNSNSTAGTDRTVCVGGTVTLGASLPNGSTGAWSKAGGVNTATTNFTNASINQSTVTGFTTASESIQKDTLRWTVSNQYCNATVSDIVVITVNPAPSRAYAGIDRQKCQGDTVRLIGNTPSIGNPSWAFPNNSIVAFTPANSGNNDSVTLQGNGGGIVRVAYRIANGNTTGQNPSATLLNGCLSTDTVTLTFGPTAVNSGPDVAICENNLTTINLAGSPLGAGESGTWSFVKKEAQEQITNINLPNTTVTNITSDTVIMRWTVKLGNCSTSDDMNIRISAKPTTAKAPANKTGCNNDTLLLIGNTPVVGTPSWALVGNTNGIAFIPNTNAGRNNDSARTRLTSPGTFNLVYTIALGAAVAGNACISRDTISITVNPTPAANAGQDQTSCNGTSFGLNGNRPSSFTSGIWSIVGGTAGAFTPINDTASTVSNLPFGENTIRWTVKNTFGCSASNNLIITRSETPTKAIAPSDITGCVGDTVLLRGSIAAVGSPSWAAIPGGAGNGITFIPVSNVGRNNDTIRVRLTGAGNYSIAYTIAVGNAATAGPCTSRDTVNIVVNAAPLTNAGVDQSNCSGANSFTLHGNKPLAPATGIWSVLNKRPATFTPINDTATTVTQLLEGTTTFRWTVKNSTGCSASDNVSIVTGASPLVSAGEDIINCANDTLQIIGTQATAGQTPTWSIIQGGAGNGPSFLPNGNNDTVRVITRGTGVYRLVYTVSVGNAGASCISRDTLNLTINPAPSATITSGTQLSCKPDSLYTLRANRPVSPATGLWSIVGNSTAVLTPNDTAATVSKLPIGVTTIQWVVSPSNGCIATATTTITRNSAPTIANGGTDRSACLGDTILVIGNTPNSGTSNWSALNSPFASIVGNGGNDTVRLRISAAGVIRMRYRISNGSNSINSVCVSTDTLLITGSACTGLFDAYAQTNNKLFVHPNPANNVLHISYSGTDAEETEMSILSIDGKTIIYEHMGHTENIEKDINVSSIPKGFYFVKIKTDKSIEHTKILIQ